MEKTFVAYARVSTARQGESGLGLEAQQAAIDAHARASGLTQVGATFVEVESGRHNSRPKLAAAISLAKKTKSRLVIAKLDRLARNVLFVATIMESGVKFTACDNPHANDLTIHILAAVAQYEAEAISARTKAALAARKARGFALGNVANLDAGGREKGSKTVQDRAVKDNALLSMQVQKLRAQGLSLREIAEQVGCNHVKVARLLKRAA